MSLQVVFVVAGALLATFLVYKVLKALVKGALKVLLFLLALGLVLGAVYWGLTGGSGVPSPAGILGEPTPGNGSSQHGSQGR